MTECKNRTCSQPPVPGRVYCQRCYTSWRAKDRRRYESTQWPKQLMRNFGITPERYWEMHAAQGGVCHICGREEQYRKLNVDHCHETGRVRGLLCSNCNRVLGMFLDKPEMFRRAADYLEGAS